MRRLGSVVLGTLAAALLTTVPATAATISISGDTLTFTAAPGEENAVSVFEAGTAGQLYINSDTVPSSRPAECTASEEIASDTLCPVRAKVVVDLGDRADSYSGGELPAGVALEVFGGAGDDVLEGHVYDYAAGASRSYDGGEGNDGLYGSQFADTLRGGPGNDNVEGWGGPDEIDGGDGDDRLSGNYRRSMAQSAASLGGDVINGGSGLDFFEDYDCCASGDVSLTLDGQANDGRAGENDNVVGVEDLITYVGGTFAGSDAAETIDARISRTGSSPATIVGNGGDDKLYGGYTTGDTLDGGAGNDEMVGGNGDDTLIGGPGTDMIDSDDSGVNCSWYSCRLAVGNDTVFARDGEIDSIECGGGTDRVVADANDVVAGSCETVERDGGTCCAPPPGQMCAAVPKVKKLKLKAARARLVAAGCSVKVKKVRSRKVKKGRVVRARRTGTVVTLRVSKGR